jgi:FKBP-type peptidyl-prolyl cis-trans isomerase SlyD
MQIEDGCLVGLKLRLRDAQGHLLEATDDDGPPLVYLHGANDIFPAIEAALTGRAAGDRLSIALEPEQAFGDFDADLVHLVPLDSLGEGAAVGMQFEGLPGEAGDGRIYRVTDIGGDVAVLDGNHPLAGIALRLDVEVASVERATDAQLEAAQRPQVPEFLRPLGPADPAGGGGHRH